jgi:predicted small integral membrane protein
MYSTPYLFRLVKTISVAGIGLLALLIVVNNIVDYLTNFAFVEHVMKMDTIFSASHIHNRSIGSPIAYHAGYCLIILMEAAMCFCCLKGALRLFRNLKKMPQHFMHLRIGQWQGLPLGSCSGFWALR